MPLGNNITNIWTDSQGSVSDPGDGGCFSDGGENSRALKFGPT